MFVQRGFCRKTSVSRPPRRPPEGTAGADTSCPSAPAWLSARRRPPPPPPPLPVSAQRAGSERFRCGDNGVFLKSDTEPGADGSAPPGGCKSNKCDTPGCAWIWPLRVYVRIPPIVDVLACSLVESTERGGRRGGGAACQSTTEGENNPRRKTSTREKTLPVRQNHRQNHAVLF